ncbi:MAG: hypothetical protein ABSA22_06840, partial [Acidimicrobiales bacterium]
TYPVKSAKPLFRKENLRNLQKVSVYNAFTRENIFDNFPPSLLTSTALVATSHFTHPPRFVRPTTTYSSDRRKKRRPRNVAIWFLITMDASMRQSSNRRRSID